MLDELLRFPLREQPAFVFDEVLLAGNAAEVREGGGVGRARGQARPRLRRCDLRRGAAMGFPIAGPLQVEDLGPLGEAIDDGVGHGLVGEDLVPLVRSRFVEFTMRLHPP